MKDNHLVCLGIGDAVARAHAAWPGRGVEVECDRVEQVREAIAAGADLVLLDNMSPEQVAACVTLVRAGPRADTLVEVSGGVTLDDVAAYAATGADLISTSALTQSAPALDVALDLETPTEHVMLLAIDAGNTQTVIGLFDGPRLTDHWRIATVAERSADELALMIQHFLAFHGFTLAVEGSHGERGDTTAGFDPAAGIGGVVISSGVPRVTAELRAMTARYFGFPALVLEPGVRTGMPILYDNPKEVGPDRIANAVAAYDLYGGPSIVVDFGTATTIEAISERGEYLGGAIFPGIEISMDALFGRAAALRRVELVAPRHVIGKVDRRVHPVGLRVRLQRPGRRPRRPVPSRARRVHGRRHGGPGRPDHQAVPHHPALRAVADPPGAAHRLRAEPMTGPPGPGVPDDGYLAEERRRRLAKLDRAACRGHRPVPGALRPDPHRGRGARALGPPAGPAPRPTTRCGWRAGCCSSDDRANSRS